jgi:prolyl oligopeptidase
MLRFRCDARGMMYILEYGDPQGSEEMFDYMYSYSPYHNIRPGTVYPWMYVQTGEMDNNVPPYHGKKFAVRLQKAADEKNPVLLEVLAHGSHDRGVGDEYYMNISQMQTFVEMGLAANRK